MSTGPDGRTAGDLAADLIALGVCPGDVLFVHASFKSLGPVDGGAATVIDALEKVVGPEGLLLMPSFNLTGSDRDVRAASWDIETTPATTGWLTEFFRRMPGTYRSDHYSHSVAARGKGAKEFVASHRRKEGLESPWDLEPWGRTYGVHSPLLKAHDADGNILMLGADYHSSTYVHVVEVLWWNEIREIDGNADYLWLDRNRLGAFWDEEGRLSRGRVGEADSRLFRIRDYVDTLLQAVLRDPTSWDRTRR